MFDVLPIAWTICLKAIDSSRYIVGLQLEGRIVGTVVLVGGGCLRANGTGHQLEGRPRQGLYWDNSSAGEVPFDGYFSTCDVEGLGIEMRD
jgi:hypothetical protein